MGAAPGGSYDHFTWQRSVSEKLDAILTLLGESLVKVGREAPRRKVVNSKDDIPNQHDDRHWEKVQLEDALDNNVWIAAHVHRWMPDRGFGFANFQGKEAFVHLGAMEGGVDHIVGKPIVVRVIRDEARGAGKLRVVAARREVTHVEEVTAARVADTAAKAAQATAAAHRQA